MWLGHKVIRLCAPWLGRVVVEPKDIPMDFLVWLGKNKFIQTQQMPSGRTAFGPQMHWAESIVKEYWESFQ